MTCQNCNSLQSTLDSGINVGVRLSFFEKIIKKTRLKNDRNALIDVKMNQKFLCYFCEEATFIQRAMSIPDSRVRMYFSRLQIFLF